MGSLAKGFIVGAKIRGGKTTLLINGTLTRVLCSQRINLFKRSSPIKESSATKFKSIWAQSRAWRSSGNGEIWTACSNLMSRSLRHRHSLVVLTRWASFSLEEANSRPIAATSIAQSHQPRVRKSRLRNGWMTHSLWAGFPTSVTKTCSTCTRTLATTMFTSNKRKHASRETTSNRCTIHRLYPSWRYPTSSIRTQMFSPTWWKLRPFRKANLIWMVKALMALLKSIQVCRKWIKHRLSRCRATSIPAEGSCWTKSSEEKSWLQRLLKG